MVQIEHVGCGKENRISEYGWKPVKHAFLEIYIDGARFRVEVGDFHDGVNYRRGLHIVYGTDIDIEKTSINACSVFQRQGH